MTPAAFRESVAQVAPPDGITGPLAGLWWARKGDWDKAHKIVQDLEGEDDDGRDAAWVHAYLHRLEGDLPNAGYWYRIAGKPVAGIPLDDEWAAIVADLLMRQRMRSAR